MEANKFSYKKLWKLMIDLGVSKKELRERSGVSAASVAKLLHGDNVTTDVLLRICNALNCEIGDIIEIVPDTDVKDG